MAHASRAWVMDVGEDWSVAAGAPQVVEYLIVPEIIEVPRVPKHCAGLMIWRNRMIPVIDLAMLLSRRKAATGIRRAVVLAYQEVPGRPLHYGAVLVDGPPSEVRVSDDMACPFAETSTAFKHLARVFFLWKDRTIPILDTQRLFACAIPDDTYA